MQPRRLSRWPHFWRRLRTMIPSRAHPASNGSYRMQLRCLRSCSTKSIARRNWLGLRRRRLSAGRGKMKSPNVQPTSCPPDKSLTRWRGCRISPGPPRGTVARRNLRRSGLPSTWICTIGTNTACPRPSNESGLERAPLCRNPADQFLPYEATLLRNDKVRHKSSSRR